MPKLKIEAIPDKVAKVMTELTADASGSNLRGSLSATAGRPAKLKLLILARFMATDRGFQEAATAKSLG